MAHVMKMKAPAVGHMLKHYERDEAAQERDNVDASRTPLNYAIATTTKGTTQKVAGSELSEAFRKRIKKAKEVHQETTGRSARYDAVLMADWVVTLPKDCPREFSEAFFATVYEFALERYGQNCVLGGYVHMDETTPHMHLPVIPIAYDEKKEGYKLCAKEVINRNDLRSFHQDLQKTLKDKGVPGTVVEAEGGGRPKITSKMSQKDLKALGDYLDKLEAENAALKVRLQQATEKKQQDERQGFDLSGLRGYEQERPGFSY